MKYAVIRVSGHQYKVSEGEEFLVDKTEKPVVDVLLTANDQEIKVGTPTVSDAKVNLTVIGDEKGEKIDVFKYKAKSRSRRKVGFRSQKTRVKVDKLAF